MVETYGSILKKPKPIEDEPNKQNIDLEINQESNCKKNYFSNFKFMKFSIKNTNNDSNENNDLFDSFPSFYKKPNNIIFISLGFFIGILLLFFTIIFIIFNTGSRFIELPNLVKVQKLENQFLPTELDQKLILIGDVHGCYNEYIKLLEKVNVNFEKDHVVLLGDMISKGPYSRKVVQHMMKTNTSCVRGNHERDLFNQYEKLHKRKYKKVDYKQVDYKQVDSFDKEKLTIEKMPKNWGSCRSEKCLAKELSSEEILYLAKCPLILDLGNLGEDNEKVVAVHAGLMWNVKNLQEQDPDTVMTVRTLLPPKNSTASENPFGIHWATVWNDQQELIKDPRDRTTVFYGHYAKERLNIQRYTKGLDSGCLKGRRLSAFVIQKKRQGNGYKRTVVSIKCKKYK